jgi:hypothetical protein
MSISNPIQLPVVHETASSLHHFTLPLEEMLTDVPEIALRKRITYIRR